MYAIFAMVRQVNGEHVVSAPALVFDATLGAQTSNRLALTCVQTLAANGWACDRR